MARSRSPIDLVTISGRICSRQALGGWGIYSDRRVERILIITTSEGNERPEARSKQFLRSGRKNYLDFTRGTPSVREVIVRACSWLCRVSTSSGRRNVRGAEGGTTKRVQYPWLTWPLLPRQYKVPRSSAAGGDHSRAFRREIDGVGIFALQ